MKTRLRVNASKSGSVEKMNTKAIAVFKMIKLGRAKERQSSGPAIAITSLLLS